MKVAICADVHLANHKRHGGKVQGGLNERCFAIVKVLEDAVRTANAEDCGAFVIAGDLFDTAHPEPPIIAAAQVALGKFQGDVFVLKGNHDEHSDDAGDHALGPLAAEPTRSAMRRIVVVEEPRVVSYRQGDGALDVDLIMMPFSKRAPVEYLRKDMPSGSSATRLLVVHMGISDERTVAWLRSSGGSIDVRDLQLIADEMHIDAVFAGDWHDHRRWGEVVQVGALVPTGWDNPGPRYGGLAIFDTALGRTEMLHLPGPRFYKFGDLTVLDTWAAQPSEHLDYVQLVVQPDNLAAATDRIQALKSTNRIAAGEVVVSQEETKKAAREAATAASAQDSIDASLDAYLEAFPLEDGVDRARVLQRLQRFLGGAR